MHLWLAAAEAAGAAVLAAWRRIRPLIVRAWRLLVAAERIAERQVTPEWAVAAVGVAALVVLAASQWLDYRAISVGNDAYSRRGRSVAPAPEVDTDRRRPRPRLGDAPARRARPGAWSSRRSRAGGAPRGC